MSAWAARYSATEEPELTIWRDGVEYGRLSMDEAAWQLSRWKTIARDFGDLRADIAARVPVRECEEAQACAHWAMPDGRCHHVHGGSDEL